MDERELYLRAVAAHYRYCKRHGYIPEQPSENDSEVRSWVDNAIIDLCNCKGLLARYRHDPRTNRLIRTTALKPTALHGQNG